ncbi:MAG: hypothetical protein WBL27_04385 [Salinimicrobium sp.]
MDKIILLLFLSGFNGFGQELTCADFKNGSFLSTSEVFGKEIHFRIIRDGNSQTEVLLDSLPGLPPGFPREEHILLEWIDNCSYYARKDSSATAASGQYSDQHSRVLVEMIKIEDGCFYYRSTSEINGEPVSINGKICKEEQLN